MTRAVFGTLVVLGIFMLVSISTAAGQDDPVYSGPLFGTLGVEGSDFTVGSTMALVGEGFQPSAPVQFSVRANASGVIAVAGDSTADGSGAVRIEVPLEDPFVAGTYTATVSGNTVDGATVELSAVVAVEALPEPTPEPATSAALPTPVPRPTSSAAPTPTAIAVSAASPTATPLPSVEGPEQSTTGSNGDTEAPIGDEQPDEQVLTDQPDATPPPGTDTEDDGAASEQAAAQRPGADTGSGWGLGRWLAALGAVVVIGGAGLALRTARSGS